MLTAKRFGQVEAWTNVPGFWGAAWYRLFRLAMVKDQGCSQNRSLFEEVTLAESALIRAPDLRSNY